MTAVMATRMLHVQHTFLYISSPSLHDCDVKMPNFTFYGGGGGPWTSDDKFFFLFLNLSAVLKKSTPGEWICLHLTFSTDWNNHNKVLKNAKFILKLMFSLLWPSSILQLSINWKKTWQEKRWKICCLSWFHHLVHLILEYMVEVLLKIQSTSLSKTDTFRTSTKCLSKGNVHVIAIKSNERSKKSQGPTLGVC